MNYFFSSIALVLLIVKPGFSSEIEPITGLFFNVVSTGATLTINTLVPKHPQPYQHAGIEILTPGFTLANPGECLTNESPAGMCTFSVSNTAPTVISITGPTGVADVKLCLDGTGPYPQKTCQHYKYTSDSSLPIQHAYVVTSSQNNLNQGYVSVCPILNSGASLGPCVPFLGDPGVSFVSPQGITFNNLGTRAYITNFGTNPASVTTCTADSSTGVLSACSTTSIADIPSGSGVHSIQGNVAIDSSNTYAYVPDFAGTQDPNSIKVYTLDGSTKALTTVHATVTDNTFNGPNSITFNQAGTLAYIANTTGNSVAVCDVVTGTLTACTDSTGVFPSALSVSFNANGQYAYVATNNGTTSSVMICTVSGKTLINCADSTQTFHFGTTSGPVGNIFMPSSHSFGYVPNADTNTLSICPIGANGILGTCNPVTDPQFITPTGVALNPVS